MTSCVHVKPTIDEEWEQFITSSNSNNRQFKGGFGFGGEEDESCDDIECEWQGKKASAEVEDEAEEDENTTNVRHELVLESSEAPTPSDIYISTKTKIAYLNTPVDLADVFWKIPVIDYCLPQSGVIKKQMKFNSLTQEEVDTIQAKLVGLHYFEENIITHIDNPTGRIKFKDIRKVSIGISKKDIMSCRCKKRSAFYNCFVIILRLRIEQVFKEFHVKVFNTGKLEIPGVQNEQTFQLLLKEVIRTLQQHMETPEPLNFKPDSEVTVLINSNFNCGFFINREVLNDLLKYKYNIQSIYDPCSYPGIQCKFFFNPDVDVQTGCQISEENKQLFQNVKQVSFMIFRTGSVLIVGKCDENVLLTIYTFLKDILVQEYKLIHQKVSASETAHYGQQKHKTKKVRRKHIMFDHDQLPDQGFASESSESESESESESDLESAASESELETEEEK